MKKLLVAVSATLLVSAVGFAQENPFHATNERGETVHVDIAMHREIPSGAYAGLTFEDELHDVVVSAVAPGGPASTAGIAVGDRLVSIDGAPMGAADRVTAELEIRRPGTTVTLVLERDDKPLTVTLTLAAAPAR